MTTADLLLLTPYGVSDLPDSMLDEMAVTTLSQNSMYLAMGCIKSKWSYSLFARYGNAASEKRHAIKPHSLRHLMNTELFKLGVSDTVITQQFGRMSVARGRGSGLGNCKNLPKIDSKAISNASQLTHANTSLAIGPTLALGGAKQLITAAENETLESHIELETRTVARMSVSADAKEGIAAFRERRMPIFSGASKIQ